MSYTKRTWIVENTWICDSCGHKNRGRDMKCKKCGSPKESREEYDTSKNLTSAPVTDPELLKLANDAPNWSCSYCKNDIRNRFGECSVCGGPKTLIGTQKVLEDRMAAKKAAKANATQKLSARDAQIKASVKESLNNSNVVIGVPSKTTNYSYNSSYPGMDKKQAGFIILGMLAFITVLTFFVWLFSDTERHTVVSSTYWNHTAHLEQRYTLHGTGWEDEAPSGHFNNICETRQHGTHDCNPYDCNPHSVSYECNCHEVSAGESCHTSCSNNGNGFSSCSETCTPNYRTECSTCNRTEYDTCYHQCPTYEQWCSYDYHKWNVIATSVTQGHNNHDLIDPTDLVPQTTSHGPQRLNIDRQYIVTFADYHDRDDDTHLPKTFDITPNSASEFNRYSYGEHWLIRTNHIGNVSPIRLETTNNTH